MLRNYLKFFFIGMFALNILALSTGNATEQKTVVLDVPGMTCNFCPITIKKALRKVEGVIKADADYDTKTATVIFDPAKTNVDALIKATTNAGYPSTVKK